MGDLESKQLSKLISISADIKNILLNIKGESVEKGQTKTSKSKSTKSLLSNTIFTSSSNLINAISSKGFTKQKADLFLNFTKSLIDITSNVKKTSATNYTNFMNDVTKSTNSIIKIFSPKTIFQLALIQKTLFNSKNNIFSKIITGLIEPFETIKTTDVNRMKKMGESIESLGIGLSKITKSLFLLIPLGLASPLVLLGAFTIKLVLNIFTSIGKKSKDIQKGAIAMKDISNGLLMITAGLASLTLYIALAGPGLVAASVLVLFGIVELVVLLSKNFKNIKKGSDTLIDIGKSLILFSSALAILSLAILLSGPTVLLAGVGLIALYVSLYLSIGMMQKYIKQGEQVLTKDIALSIVGFTLSMIIVALAIKQFGIENIMISIGLVTLIGGIFVGLGALSKLINKGEESIDSIGKSLIFIGIGVLSLGLSIKLLQLMFKKSDVGEAIGIATGLILGLALIYTAVGALGKFIDMGINNIKKIGTSLLLFSLGILSMAIVLKITMMMFRNEDPNYMLMIIGGILVGTALAFVALAALSTVISTGASSLLLIGVSIVLFSASLLLFEYSIKKILLDFNDVSQFTNYSTNLIWEFGKSFMILGVLSPFIILGSASLLSMSVPLILFSTAIIILSNGLSNLMKPFKDLNNASTQISNFIISMGMAVAKLGILLPFILLGSVSGSIMSGTLLLISGGLMSFGKTMDYLSNKGMLEQDTTTKKSKLKGLDIIDYLYTTISNIGNSGNILKVLKGSFIINVLSNSITDIARSLKRVQKHLTDMPSIKTSIESLFEDKGIFSVLLSGFVSIAKQDNKSYRKGIRITKKISSVLSEIAGGIVAFAKFEKFPIKVPDPKDPHKLIHDTVNLFTATDTIKEKLPTLLTALSDVFSDIGIKNEKNDKSVKKGIKSVKGLGDVLSSLAGGIAAFANFENFPIQVANNNGELIYDRVNIFNDIIPKIKDNLTGDNGILYLLSNIFGEIGSHSSTDGDTTDIPETKKYKAKDIRRGIRSLTGMGDVLSSLAGGIAAFANFKNFPVQIANDKGELIYDNVDLSLVIPDIKTVLIGDKLNPGILFALTDILVEAGEKIKGNKRNIKKSVDAFSSVSDVFNNIISGIVAFADIEKGIPTFNKQGSIIGYTSIDITKMTTHISSIITAIPNMFANLDKTSLDNANKNMPTFSLFTNELEKMAKMSSNLDKFADSLTKLGSAFIDLNKGFSVFSKSVPSFSQFESSISTLSKNQKAYGFSQFTKSMGELKTNVNAFDTEKLKLTNSMMNSMAIISKAPEALASRITETLETSFQELVKVIKEISDKETSKKEITYPETTTSNIKSQPAIKSSSQLSTTSKSSESSILSLLEKINTNLGLIAGYTDGLEDTSSRILKAINISGNSGFGTP